MMDGQNRFERLGWYGLTGGGLLMFAGAILQATGRYGWACIKTGGLCYLVGLLILVLGHRTRGKPR